VPVILLAVAIFVAAELLSPGYSQSHRGGRFFGVGLSRPAGSGELTTMRGGGVRTVRVVLDWRLVQPRRGGPYRWAVADRFIADAARHDLEVFPHPYSPTLRGFRYQLERIRATMRRHHDPSPIWIDEIGWASARHGSRYAAGPEGQARMLRRALGFARAHRRRLGIGRVLWYPWRDTSQVAASCALCKSSGLRARSGRPKPAWRAYQRVAG
jgi:hypothetical protein